MGGVSDLRGPPRVRLVPQTADHAGLNCVRCGETLASATSPNRPLEISSVELGVILSGHRCTGGAVQW
jgi:hypothetical protein